MSTSETITKTDLKNILEAAGSIGSVDSTPTPTASKVSEFDAAAQMNSTDMTSQEVTSFVEDLNIEGGGSGTSIPTANTAAKFDANANMNSSDMTSSVVDNFIGDLNISSTPVIERTQSDWVVETETNGSVAHRRWQSGLEEADWVVGVGTEGNWTYRKWNSGIAECWGFFTATLTNYASSVFGAGGAYGYNLPVTFPTNLFVATPVIAYSAYVGGGFAVTGTKSGNRTATGVTLYAVASATGSQLTEWDVHVVGRWKERVQRQ